MNITLEHHTSKFEEMQLCIYNCQESHRACLETLTHCLGKGGKHAEPTHIRMLLDCAEICQLSANFMLRESPLHHFTCGVCSKICERCAGDCERLDPGDEHMRHCAELCRECAATCKDMAAHHKDMDPVLRGN
jgi:hypothetical protein